MGKKPQSDPLGDYLNEVASQVAALNDRIARLEKDLAAVKQNVSGALGIRA